MVPPRFGRYRRQGLLVEWPRMDFVAFALDFVLRIDKHLAEFVTLYGAWVYALLFAIIFVETGVVVMPFLPGDSLLFVAGSLAAGAAPSLDLLTLFGLLFTAAVLWIGSKRERRLEISYGGD